jgi:hypothetical protein
LRNQVKEYKNGIEQGIAKSGAEVLVLNSFLYLYFSISIELERKKSQPSAIPCFYLLSIPKNREK